MKKFIVFLSLFLLVTSPVFALTTLYEKVFTSQISSGAILKNYTRLTDEGWENINVIEVDLKDKNTSLELINSNNGVSTLQNVLSMASNNNAIAAINGDFFGANSGKGNSVGLAINNSEIISSSYHGNEQKSEFATFAIDSKDNVFCDYFTNTITLTSQKTKESVLIDDINKYPRSYEATYIYTPAWGECSLGCTDDVDIVQIVVKNNKIIDVIENGDPIQIPEKGYVVSAFGKDASFLYDNFKKGTKVTLDTEFNINVDKINFAISGGAILVKDGEIPEKFDSNITGNHPRTAIGISKNEKTVYLVTVDGRQKSSIGMTQTALAELLKDIGAYNAINLDGGGSTTMVARKLGDNDLSVINSPSEGSLRSVINGVGVFSNASSSNKATKLIIELDDTNIFKGKKRAVTVKGYNKYFNPVNINENNIKWSYNGVPVTVKNGVITGDTVGMTMLTAKLGNATATIEINILSNPNELSVFPKKSTISSGKNISFTTSAKNKNGYYSVLGNNELDWKIESFSIDGQKQNNIPNDAFLKNGSFTASTSGDYIISASSEDIISYALVTVSGITKNIVYDFETQKYGFDPYPDDVGGNAEQSSAYAHSRKLFLQTILRF